MWTATPILGARDVVAMLTWLTSALGFEEVARFGVDASGAPAYGIVVREAMAIHVQVREHDPGPDRPEIETDAYVTVEDVDGLFAEYEAAGVTVFRPLYDNEYGMRDFCVEAPNGLRIAFGAPLPG